MVADPESLRRIVAEGRKRYNAARAEQFAMGYASVDLGNWVMTNLPEILDALSSPALSPQQAREAAGWQPIETAPRDGTRILLLGKPQPEVDEMGKLLNTFTVGAIEVGWWNPDGDSWVSKDGELGTAHHLEVTGVWYAGGGWFQPNEVTHWQPLPAPPSEPKP